MIKPQKKWSDKDKADLINMWPSKKVTKQQIVSHFSRTYNSIKSMAKIIGLKRPKQNKEKLKKLNKNNKQSFYWLGFLMADGHFSDRNELKFTLKNKQILQDFVNFLGVDVNIRTYKDYWVVTIADAKNIKELKYKYKICQNKTKEPCDISSIVNSKYFYDWFSGFFDGDGTICSRSVKGLINGVRIQIDNSWLESLIQIKVKLEKDNIRSRVYIDNQGYARLVIFGIDRIKILRSKISQGYKLK